MWREGYVEPDGGGSGSSDQPQRSSSAAGGWDQFRANEDTSFWRASRFFVFEGRWWLYGLIFGWVTAILGLAKLMPDAPFLLQLALTIPVLVVAFSLGYAAWWLLTHRPFNLKLRRKVAPFFGVLFTLLMYGLFVPNPI
jgi:hypothetical protein